jgi:hypothetical protein
MTTSEIAKARLSNQHITQSRFKTVKDIVQWMGALQAQDYLMAKWAIGVRLPGSTEKLIESAIDKGEIIRTHVMRPTWHFVSAEDVYWMLALTAPHILSSMKSRNKQLGLTEKVFLKSTTVLEKALSDGVHRTREELIAELVKAKLATDDNRTSHYFIRAEADGIICSGASRGKERTYALLAQRVPIKNILSKEESLSRLARNYIRSHAPATLQDFIWWSGLSSMDAKFALEMIRADYKSETIGGIRYLFFDSFSNSTTDKNAAYLLPAFDEFLVGYKDRSAVLSYEHHKRSVSDNGIFRPIIVINGTVTGLWRRSTKKGRIFVEPELFRPHRKTESRLIENAIGTFEQFVSERKRECHL